MADRRTRILGKMLAQYVGKDVIVAGNITKIASSGDTVEFMTFDNTKINITVPSSSEVNTEGVWEIWGTPKSKGTMLASQCVHFDEEQSKDFDPQKYNDVLIIQNAANDRKWKLNASRNSL